MAASLLKCSIDEYHRDPCETPSLSQSLALTLLTLSPRHAYAQHPRFGAKPQPPSEAMERGTILHKLILGKGSEFSVIRADDWRTKQAGDEREEARAARRVPILWKDFEEVAENAEAVRRQCIDFGFPFSGESEVPVQFEAEGELGPVVCRCMFDHVRPEWGVYDVKKTRSAHPRDLARAIHEYGYDLQAHAYRSAFEQLFPDQEGHSDFVFLFFETEPPYLVVPARVDGAMREIGRLRWQRAAKLWERMLRSESYPWPGYSDGAVVLETPAWVVKQELGDYA